MTEWQPIDRYKIPTKEEADGEKVLLGHWMDYGKDEDYFGPNCWAWVASGSIGYDINGELKIWIDKDDDFMPFTNDFNKVTHFAFLSSEPPNGIKE